MAEKTEISDEMLEFINGGTEQETSEMEAYVRRKFPEFNHLPREDAIATALIAYLPISRTSFYTYTPKSRNVFITYEGRPLSHAQVMDMLREKYGD